MKSPNRFSVAISLLMLLILSHDAFSQDLTKGLVAYWPFCGCTAKDATGNGHDGTLTNGPTCVTGKFDQAYQFDGTNTIDVPFSSAFDIPQDSELSLAAWVKPSRVGDFYQALVVKGTNAAWDYGIYMDIGGGFMFGTSWPAHETISTTKPMAGQWYHVCGVYWNRNWKLFINGQLEATDLNATPIGRSTNGIGMAQKGNSSVDMYAGTLDEVRLYNRALSDSEVAELYRLSPPQACGVTPMISYLIPDIGARGMNTYVEFIAPHNANGNFGPDSLYANNPGDPIRVVCSNPADTTKLTIGPVVVSWDGRVIFTQVFVGTCASPNSSDWRSLDSEFRIPLKVIVNGASSNADTFFIVKPLPALVASGGGIFGSGGQWGIRSKRGALLFDSISLNGGTYTVSTADCDPVAPGNQGYLPVTILSKGQVSFLPGTVLSVSSTGYDGGPGGGGGSMGDGPAGDTGGSGFVGGSPGESVNVCPATGGTGTGGIGDVNGGGIGLNGIPTEQSNVPQCEYYGGTGNPFVSEGGGVLSADKREGDGNGGGFGTAGDNGRGENGFAPALGGIVNGNAMLVPLMGGSGGGGGNEFCACDAIPPGAKAGGGGGSILLFAPQLSLSTASLTSNGASGVTGGVGCVGHGSVGGCGSGGGVILQAKLASAFPSVSAMGGVSLHTHLDAGNGGVGRVRFDGPIINALSISPANASFYRGLSTDMTSSGSGMVMLSGTGNGNTIRIYSKTGSGPWVLTAMVGNYLNNQWSYSIAVPSGIATYVVSMQEVSTPSTASATMEPSWVMSQAAANILNAGDAFLPEIASTPIPPVTGCADTSVWEPISIGCSQFRIDSVKIEGDSGYVFYLDSKQKLPRTIDYNGSDSVHVIFVPPGPAGTFHAYLHLFGTLLGSGAQFDTSIALIGTALLTSTQRLHREAASAYVGQLDTLQLGVDISSAINLDSLWPYVQDIQATYAFDSSVVGFDSYSPPAGWALTSLISRGDAVDFSIHNVSATAANPLVLGTALFYPHSLQLATSWVTLPRFVIDEGGHALSLCVTDNEDSHWSVKTLGVQSGVAETPTVSGDGISVFPNPAESEFFVRNANAHPALITVYDAIGRSVATANVGESSTSTIDITSLARGSYVVVCHVGDRMVVRRLDKDR